MAGIEGVDAATTEISSTTNESVPVDITADYREGGSSVVIQLPTVTELDDTSAIAFLNRILYPNAGEIAEEDLSVNACSCLYVPLKSEGVSLMGRNMDLPLTDYPAWIFYVDAPDRYRSFNMGYFGSTMGLLGLPATDEVVERKEIPALTYKILPYLVTDAMNEKGLRIEVNKRIAPCSELNCRGTNPSSDILLSNATLMRYLTDRCATIEEVLELVPTLNLYNPQTQFFNSNIALSMMDATGRFGVMEFADERIIWHEGHPGHTNFWIDEDSRKISNVSNGAGRWASLQKSAETIQSAKDMWDALEKVYREQVFQVNADEVTYDFIPDFRYNFNTLLENAIQLRDEGKIVLDQERIDDIQKILNQDPEYQDKVRDAAFLLNGKNRGKVLACYNFMKDVCSQLSATDLQKSGMIESTVFSYISSSEEPVLYVKFFEHDDVYTFPAVENNLE